MFAVSYVRNVRGRAMLPDSTVFILRHCNFALNLVSQKIAFCKKTNHYTPYWVFYRENPWSMDRRPTPALHQRVRGEGNISVSNTSPSNREKHHCIGVNGQHYSSVRNKQLPDCPTLVEITSDKLNFSAGQPENLIHILSILSILAY